MFLSLRGIITPNHTYVVISDIGSTIDTALSCNTNYKPDDGDHSEGYWFGPDGQTVGNFTTIPVPGFRRNRDPGLVRLIRYPPTETPPEGIYRCEIQDDTLTTQTLYVGLYNSGGGLLSQTCLLHLYKF